MFCNFLATYLAIRYTLIFILNETKASNDHSDECIFWTSFYSTEDLEVTEYAFKSQDC